MKIELEFESFFENKKFEMFYQLPIIDKSTNLLFGNGITLEILKNTEYKEKFLAKNIILNSFNLQKEFEKPFPVKINLHLKDNCFCKMELNKRLKKIKYHLV